MTITNNQQIVGGSGRVDGWVEARGWGPRPIVWGGYSNNEKKTYVKYSIAFGWPLINNSSHNNQSKIGVQNGVKNGEEVQRARGV